MLVQKVYYYREWAGPSIASTPMDLAISEKSGVIHYNSGFIKLEFWIHVMFLSESREVQLHVTTWLLRKR